MLLHGEPRQPEDDPHVALPAVADQLLEVDVRIGREGVAGILCPPLVHDDVGDPEVRREVDEIFVRRGVEPRHEVHIRPVWRRGVPELPAHLPGVYPRGVVEAAGAGEPRGHGVFDQVRVTVGDDEVPPREGPVARRLGNEVGFAEDLHAAVPCLPGKERHLGKYAFHAVPGASGEEHTGIILEPGLADEDLVPFPGVEQRGQYGQPLRRAPLGGADLLVGLLVGGPETPGLLDDGRIVFGKPDREGLVEHLHGSLSGGEDAVCHAVVVGAELQGPPSAEVDPQGVVAVPDGGELERHDGPERPVFGRGLVADGLCGEVVCSCEFYSQGAVHQQGHAVARHGVCHLLSGVYRDRDSPVGGFQVEVFCRQGGSQQEHCRQEEGFSYHRAFAFGIGTKSIKNNCIFNHSVPRSLKLRSFCAAAGPEKRQASANICGSLSSELFPGGEDEIRTRGTGYPVRRFSKPVVSATHPPLRAPLRGLFPNRVCKYRIFLCKYKEKGVKFPFLGKTPHLRPPVTVSDLRCAL